MMLSAIAAVSTNNIIGQNNKLPWHRPGDLKFFKDVTTDCNVVMGRKTFESLGCTKLPNRFNIVMSRKDYCMKCADGTNVRVINDVRTIFSELNPATKDTWIIGGEKIYGAFMPFLSNIVITRIPVFVPLHDRVDSVSVFPNINLAQWKMEEYPHPYDEELTLEIYTRRPNGISKFR